MQDLAPFPCACGCGRLVTPSGRRRFASDACRQRGHQQRQGRARREVAVAAETRGDLVALLALAEQHATTRPGSVVLRVAGRLHALDAGELRELLDRARGPDARPVPAPASMSPETAPPPPMLTPASAQVLQALADQVERMRLAARASSDCAGMSEAQIDGLYKALSISNDRTCQYIGDLPRLVLVELAELLAAHQR